MLNQSLLGKRRPCASAPTISAVTKTDDVLNNCPTGWVTTWGLTIAGTLQGGQEYYWERATDAAGTSWSYWARGTATTRDSTDLQIGATDLGNGSQTRYCRMRVSIVPVGVSPPPQCSGPTTGVQASRTGYNCTI
jgi:hypothetical protein